MRGDLKLRHSFRLLVIAGAFAIAACSSSPTASATPTPNAGSLAQNPSKSTPSGTATPTSLDPCQLVTSQEASSLAGTSYRAGVAQTYSGSQGCIYGYQTLNVFSVLVAQAASPAAAQAQWDQEQSQAQATLAKVAGASSSLSVNVNDVSNLSGADRAAVGAGTFPFAGHTFGMSVIYVIKGGIFFTFADIVVGRAGPSTSAIEAEAQTVIGRLP